ncbi:hypothetical protein JHD48_03090 [Sulfurimonas sp. SAG-AH-194-I05]|nr:hypothetical protein [Sulfurimonas sp. SAG-AH-194-I05]MDF1874718.1 hypothetical protein [Sulfurimonas sp. SAG-AH-194-I05]
MQKILNWFTPIIGIGVAIFIVLFLISINAEDEFIEVEPLVYESSLVQEKPKQVWLNHFSKSQRLGYFYPVNEVYVKVDLDERITKAITYKLSAPLLDPYQLFCLKEELKQHKLKYFLEKDAYGVELLIFSKNIAKLNSLVKVLKNYQISATVTSYKEEYK